MLRSFGSSTFRPGFTGLEIVILLVTGAGLLTALGALTSPQLFQKKASEEGCEVHTSSSTCPSTTCQWLGETTSCSGKSEADCASTSGCTKEYRNCSGHGSNEVDCENDSGCTFTATTSPCSFINNTCPSGCTHTPRKNGFCSNDSRTTCTNLGETDCTRRETRGECSWNIGTSASCTGTRITGGSCSGSPYIGCSGSYGTGACTELPPTSTPVPEEATPTPTSIPTPTNTPRPTHVPDPADDPRTPTPTPVRDPTCSPEGKTQCVGSVKQQCRFGEWTPMQDPQECRPTPTPRPTSTPTPTSPSVTLKSWNLFIAGTNSYCYEVVLNNTNAGTYTRDECEAEQAKIAEFATGTTTLRPTPTRTQAQNEANSFLNSPVGQITTQYAELQERCEEYLQYGDTRYASDCAQLYAITGAGAAAVVGGTTAGAGIYALAAGAGPVTLGSLSTATAVYGTSQLGALASIPAVATAVNALANPRVQQNLQTAGVLADAVSFEYSRELCDQGDDQACQNMNDIAMGNVVGLQMMALNAVAENAAAYEYENLVRNITARRARRAQGRTNLINQMVPVSSVPQDRIIYNGGVPYYVDPDADEALGEYVLRVVRTVDAQTPLTDLERANATTKIIYADLSGPMYNYDIGIVRNYAAKNEDLAVFLGNAVNERQTVCFDNALVCALALNAQEIPSAPAFIVGEKSGHAIVLAGLQTGVVSGRPLYQPVLLDPTYGIIPQTFSSSLGGLHNSAEAALDYGMSQLEKSTSTTMKEVLYGAMQKKDYDRYMNVSKRTVIPEFTAGVRNILDSFTRPSIPLGE